MKVNTTASHLDWSRIDRTIINLAGEWIGLGDVITTAPLVAAIRSASPKCQIQMIVTGRKWNAIVGMMEGNVSVTSVCKDFYRFRSLFLCGCLRLWRPWLETVYFYDYMAPVDRASLLGYLTGAKFRFGYGNGTTKRGKESYNTHFLDYESIGVTPFSYSNKFERITGLTCPSMARLRRNGLKDRGSMLINSVGANETNPLFAFHPGSSSSLRVKRWALTNFDELAQELNRRYCASILVILGSDERELRKNWPTKSFVTFVEENSICDVAAILGRCTCLISNDSGIMNLGLSLGIPGVGLFGPTDCAKHYGWYPKSILIQSKYNSACPPCYGSDRFWECGKMPPLCMESITVDEVIEKVQGLL